MVMRKRTKKTFSIRFVTPKSFTTIKPNRQNVTASSREIAIRKFRRESVFRRQKIIGASEIRGL